MKHPVTAALTQFLKTHCDHQRSLLLALSGGPDSMALLHALADYSRLFPVAIGVVHVDHRWREESEQEAINLRFMVETMGLTYHERVLNPALLSGNLENACRNERYRFFSELTQHYGYQAVITGHQSDDLAETVLKRLFEGSAFPFISGIREIVHINALPVWRPLLTVSKKQILEYVDINKLPTIDDRTNVDSHYLRARMRTEMIPALNENFGKQIAPGLCRIAQESQELHSYLTNQVEKYLNAVIEGPFGLYWDFYPFPQMHPTELKFLIRLVCDKLQIAISREAIDTLVSLLVNCKANKSISCTDYTFYVDRRRLFILKNDYLDVPQEPVLIELEKVTTWGRWKIQSKVLQKSMPSTCSWKDLWRGEGSIIIPLAHYELQRPTTSHLYPRSHSISKWWTDNQVPTFLRQIVPLVVSNGKLACELLTGRQMVQQQSTNELQWVQLTLSLYR